MPLISIVTGTFNEAENIEECRSRIRAALKPLAQYDYEIIVIDNASVDGTSDILRREAAADPHLKVILNARNFGHLRSPYYALLQAKGDAVIYLASDLQAPPEMIPQFLEQWEKGFKAVVGVKNQSEETPLFFFVRRCYYQLVYRLADTKIIQNYTGFGLYDKRVLDICRKINDPYPYFRGLVSEIGLPTTAVPFVQPTRKRGLTKNNFYTLFDTAMLGITNHSKVPLRLATLFGFSLSFLSFPPGRVRYDSP